MTIPIHPAIALLCEKESYLGWFTGRYPLIPKTCTYIYKATEATRDDLTQILTIFVVHTYFMSK